MSGSSPTVIRLKFISRKKVSQWQSSFQSHTTAIPDLFWALPLTIFLSLSVAEHTEFMPRVSSPVYSALHIKKNSNDKGPTMKDVR